jgi:hypothetical protein
MELLGPADRLIRRDQWRSRRAPRGPSDWRARRRTAGLGSWIAAAASACRRAADNSADNSRTAGARPNRKDSAARLGAPRRAGPSNPHRRGEQAGKARGQRDAYERRVVHGRGDSQRRSSLGEGARRQRCGSGLTAHPAVASKPSAFVPDTVIRSDTVPSRSSLPPSGELGRNRRPSERSTARTKRRPMGSHVESR